MRLDPVSAEAEMVARVADFEGMKVLEIGSGDGRMTSMISRQAESVLSIDTDADLIANALARNVATNTEYRVGDICDIQLEPRGFDCAFLALSI